MNRTRPIVNQKLTNRLLAAVVSLFLLLGLVPLTVLADSYGPQGEGFKVNMVDPSAANIVTTNLSNGDYLNEIGLKYDPTEKVSFRFDAGNGSGTNHIESSLFNGYVKLFTSQDMTEDSLAYTYGSNPELTITDIGDQGTLQRGRRFQIDMTGLQPAMTYYLVFVKGLATDRVSMGNYNLLFEFQTVADASAVDSVSLDQSALLFEGLDQTYDLTETIVPAGAANKTVSWTSSDDTVASVDAAGLVTAKKAGTAVVTVTTQDGGKTATCDIEVQDTQQQRVLVANKGSTVHRVSGSEVNYAITKPDLLYELVKDPEYYIAPETVTPGVDFTMAMEVYPNGGRKSTTFKFHLYSDAELTNEITDTVSFSSTDGCDAAVTVKTDSLKGNSTYYLVLDKTSTSGSVAFGKNVIIEFQTGASTKDVETVTLDHDALILDGIDQSFSLEATVLPSTAENKTVSWSTSDASVATVNSSGTLTPVAKGSATITVTTEDGEKTATCVVEVRESDNQRVLIPQTNEEKYTLTESGGFFQIREPEAVYQVVGNTAFVIPSAESAGEDLNVTVELNPTSSRSSTRFVYKLYSDKELSQEVSDAVKLSLPGDTIGTATVSMAKLTAGETYYLVLDKTTNNGDEPLGQDLVFEFTAEEHKHVEEVVPGKAATCTETGLTDGKKCSVCGEILEAQKEIPALGHDYKNGTCTRCAAADPNYKPEEPDEPVVLNGIVKGPDGNWAMYKDNKVVTSYTGIAKNQYGWWRVENGYVNFNAQGIYKNDYGWWKTTDGKVTFDETGVFKNEYGWWRVEKSKVNFKADGIYKNDYGWWKTTGGKVTFKENGVFKNEYGWWKVEKSKVNFNFTGIAKNEYGTWYIKNGKVDFSKNGKVQYNGNTYQVTDGKAKQIS
jgi:Bacterial surface proteins containing Ig-like domains